MPHLELVLLCGLAIGLAFGACGQLTGFCLQRGLQERWSGSGGYKLKAFAMALAVALLGTQALAALGLVDLTKSLYFTPSYSWLLVALGGLMFGYGMGLANGCGARALVLLGQGNLRSLVVLLCLGIAAYMTLTGVLGNLRVTLTGYTAISPGAVAVPAGWARALVALVAAGALLFYALRLDDALPGRCLNLLGGVIIGALVTAGWYVTGTLGADEFEPVPVVSLTFVAPIGDVIQYAMLATGMSLRFGIVVVLGVVLGSFITALLRRQHQLAGFEQPRQMLRYMCGGALMGSGGALALGCSIGQGLSGLSTLSYSSMLAAGAIVLGARLAWARRAAGAAAV